MEGWMPRQKGPPVGYYAYTPHWSPSGQGFFFGGLSENLMEETESTLYVD